MSDEPYVARVVASLNGIKPTLTESDDPDVLRQRIAELENECLYWEWHFLAAKVDVANAKSEADYYHEEMEKVAEWLRTAATQNQDMERLYAEHTKLREEFDRLRAEDERLRGSIFLDHEGYLDEGPHWVGPDDGARRN